MITMRRVGVAALLLLLVCLLAARPALAQGPDGGTSDEAIALAQSQPEIAEYLSRSGEWDAAAYFTGNRFGVWRVHFWDKQGNSLGYADLSLERGVVYSWQPSDYLEEALWAAGEEALWEFVRANEDVRAVLDVYDVDYDEDPFDGWTEYHGEANVWSAYIWQAGDFIEARVRFDSGSRQVFENPVLVGVYFPTVLNIWEWTKAQEAQAVSFAFSFPSVAEALRGVEGWTAAGEPETLGGSVWRVTFSVNDAPVLFARVDLAAQTLLEVGIP